MKKANIGFVCLMAFLMSLIALAIDAMLPALGDISRALLLENANDGQYILSFVFLGMAAGLMLYGPLSDAYGRKKSLYLGISIFLIGCVFSMASQSFEVMLIGRFLQGFGGASCRVVSTAMIRDRFSGPQMGEVMSLIMVFFVIVPALAPSVGQLILYIANWRAIFGLFFILALVAVLLLHFRLEETLKGRDRIPFSFKSIIAGSKETLLNSVSRNYTIAAGLVFGAFVGYLSSAQQIFQVQFKLGDKFSFYFGGLALCIGVSSFINSKLVQKYGMDKLSFISLLFIGLLSGVYLLFLFFTNSTGGGLDFMLYMGSSFLFVGVLFGNLNTMAIEPLGHIAGIANSVISSFQTFISVAIGGVIGQLYTESVIPLVLSFFILSLLAAVIVKKTKKLI